MNVYDVILVVFGLFFGQIVTRIPYVVAPYLKNKKLADRQISKGWVYYCDNPRCSRFGR